DDGAGAWDGAPGGDGGGLDERGLGYCLGEARRELGNECPVARAQAPGAVALGYGVAGGTEGFAQGVRRIWASRVTEALVAVLVGVERLQHRRIGRVVGCPALIAVVGEHGVECRPAFRDGASEGGDE